MSDVITYEQSRLLFRTLAANGAFSAGAGLIMTLGARPVADWIGLSQPAWLGALGVGLLGFGGVLLWLARRGRVRTREAAVIFALDLGWVIGSAIIVVTWPGLLSEAGVIATLIVALIVLTFFDLQAYGLWRARRQP